MGWVLDEAPGTEKLAEYESRLNEFYANNNALGLCQYNRTTLPAAMLDHCIATHRLVRIDGPIALENPFYELPQKAMGRRAQPERVPSKMRAIFAQAEAASR
jgi:MEDS: MEthanogen/methylotroph, DcmR Sensory domain